MTQPKKPLIERILPWKLVHMLIRSKRLFTWIYEEFVFFFAWTFTRNRPIKSINRFERKVYSQNGEDGILRIIFHKLKTTNRFYVEFGVEDGSECNTRLLRKRGWTGLMMDAGKYDNPLIKRHFITRENINGLFRRYKVPKEFDLLSIDIDFNDYWVWKAIKGYSPRVVCIEYNSTIPADESVTVKYNPKGNFQNTNYYGASLKAYVKLARQMGYELIGCDKKGINAFFVKKSLVKGNFVKQPIERLYRPPRFGRKVHGKNVGYGPDDREWVKV